MVSLATEVESAVLDTKALLNVVALAACPFETPINHPSQYEKINLLLLRPSSERLTVVMCRPRRSDTFFVELNIPKDLPVMRFTTSNLGAFAAFAA